MKMQVLCHDNNYHFIGSFAADCDDSRYCRDTKRHRSTLRMEIIAQPGVALYTEIDHISTSFPLMMRFTRSLVCSCSHRQMG